MLVEGAVPYNENVTVDEFLERSFEEGEGRDYSDKEWFKKTDWWKEGMARAKEK